MVHKESMKIAVIDHVGNAGGGSRFIRCLLPAIKKARPESMITFFGNGHSLERENFSHELIAAGINVQKLRSQVLGNLKPFGVRQVGAYISLLQQKFASKIRFLPHFLSGALHKEVEEITRGCDIAFFPWPYFINCPLSIKCPMVATFHDFNYRYYFTGQSYSPTALEVLNREMPLWLENSYPVVSTNFMKDEMCKFFPQFGDKAKVIHLAPLSSLSNFSTNEAQEIIDKMGITQPYILYPTNVAAHKNVGAIIAAHYLLKQMGHNILLIIVGFGTETINGRSFQFGIERDGQNKDVMGLGYVSNSQMDALIQCAQIVVSTSLYEAGNGPGLDAWAKGVPVAMSNIPAFIEHLDVQGVRAAVYNPLSPSDIAEKLHAVLRNPQKAHEDAQHSKEAIAPFTWDLAAKKYLDIFDEAISHKSCLL